MSLRDNLPLRYFLMSMVILVIFIGGDMVRNTVSQAGGVALAWQVVTGQLSPYGKIINANSRKIMDVFNADTGDNVSIIQWTDKNGSNQLWQFVKAGAGYYMIRNKNSGKLLDVRDGSTAEGAPVVQMAENGSDSQLWRKIDAGSGYCKLKNKKSGMLLEVSGYSTDDGANIAQSPDNGGTNQQWKIVQ